LLSIKILFNNYDTLNETELYIELEKLKNKPFSEIGYKASSIVSLLISRNTSSLREKDLSDLCLKGTDFTGADLTGTKFIKKFVKKPLFMPFLTKMLPTVNMFLSIGKT